MVVEQEKLADLRRTMLPSDGSDNWGVGAWEGNERLLASEEVSRLRGGGDSGGEGVAPDRESSEQAPNQEVANADAGADSVEPMDVQQDMSGKEDVIEGGQRNEVIEGGGQKSEELPVEADRKVEGPPQKKWTVECNGMQAEMLLVHNRCVFRCQCATCLQTPQVDRPEMTPNEFELHAGSRSKKWRTSIRAILPDSQGGARIPLGKILEDNGLGRRQSNFDEASPSRGPDGGDPSGRSRGFKSKRPMAPSGRHPSDDYPPTRQIAPYPDPFHPGFAGGPEPPRLFGRTIYDQPIANGGVPMQFTARPMDPLRGNPPGSAPDGGRAVSSGRVAVDVELVNLGRLVGRSGWWDDRSIYPAGYRSAVSFYSTRDVTRKCLFFQEIVEHWDPSTQPGPIFKVLAEDCLQTPFIGSSPDECWAEIQGLVNNGLRQLRQDPAYAAAHKSLPLAVADVSGLDMFGLTDPAIIRLVEALDPHRNCREYWARRQGGDANNGNRGTETGLGRDERLLRSLFDKGSMEELQALARVFTTLGGTGGLERVYRAALDVLERRIS